MFELFRLGGWVLPIIILAAVISLAIIGNRFWVLRTRRIAPPELSERVEVLVERGKVQEAAKLLYESNTPLARLMVVGLQLAGKSRDDVKEAIEEEGRQEVALLERHLNLLGSIAGVSPLLGLLGTVFGIMHAFAAIGAVGVGDPKALASGIAEALITTAGGLVVAIPSLMMYRFFRGRVDGLILQVERETLKVVDLVTERK